jgi:hypothetical protein
MRLKKASNFRVANPLYSKGSALEGAEIVISKRTKHAARAAARADIRRQRLSLARVMVSGLLCLAKVTVSRMCRAGDIIIAEA